MLPLLILDLDETLLHSTTEPPPGGHDFDDGAYFTRVRPHLREFLELVEPHYRLGIFTAAGLYYALDMLKGIRRTTRYPLDFDAFHAHLFDYRHCDKTQTPEGERVTKDLRHFLDNGYQPHRVIALDDKPEVYERHPRNVLAAPAWTGDPNDTFLRDIAPLLVELSAADDLPSALPELLRRTA